MHSPPTNGEPYFDSYTSMWELAQSLQTEEDGTVVRWGLSSKGWDAQSFLGIARSLLAAEGTDWWDNDNKNFNIDTDAGVQAMELFVATPVAMGIETELDQNHVDAALAGKVALARGNGTPMIEGHKHGYSYELTGAPRVTPPDAPLFVGEGGWGFVAPRQSKQPDVSIAFLRMVGTLEGQTEYAPDLRRRRPHRLEGSRGGLRPLRGFGGHQPGRQGATSCSRPWRPPPATTDRVSAVRPPWTAPWHRSARKSGSRT